MSEFKYTVRVGLHDLIGTHPDKLCANGDPSPMAEWCMDNVGTKNISWKRLFNMSGRQNEIVIYYFKHEHDSIMFKLTWADSL